MKSKYELIEGSDELKRRLRDCSPHRDYGYYIIGPTLTGRIAHLASARSKHHAKQALKEYREREQNKGSVR